MRLASDRAPPTCQPPAGHGVDDSCRDTCHALSNRVSAPPPTLCPSYVARLAHSFIGALGISTCTVETRVVSAEITAPVGASERKSLICIAVDTRAGRRATEHQRVYCAPL